MANKQDAIIYIEKENHTEAEFMSRNFVNKEIKNRAYLNALGAELVMKYISSEGIKINDTHNLHSISKILENIDISDILLPNIHIDVRVVFDDKQIFIPKSHLEMEIEPDIYVVLKLEENFKHAELLGYFKPSQINRRNENKEYYFFEKNRLSSTDTLTKFIKEFTGKTSRNLSEEDFFRGRELSISLADHNLSVSEEKELLELLLLSSALRESVLEFDNFETLSYSTAPILAEMLAPVVETKEPTEEPETTNESSLAAMALDEEIDIDEAFPEEDIIEEEEEELVVVEDTEEITTDSEEFSIDEISEEEPVFEIEEEVTKENFETTTEESLEETVENNETVLEFDDFTSEITEEANEDVDILDILEETTPTKVEEPVDILADTEETIQLDDIEEVIETPVVEELENLIEEGTSEEDFSTIETFELEERTEEITEDKTFELAETLEETIEEALEDELSIPETLSLDETEVAPIKQLEEAVETLDIESVEEEQALEEPSLNADELAIDEIEALPLEEPLHVEETLEVEKSVPTLNLDDAPTLEIDSSDIGEDLLGEDLLNETEELTETLALANEEEEEVVSQEPTLPEIEETYTPLSLEEMSVDSILDQTIAAIDTDEKTKGNNTDLDVAASATAEALANAVAEGEAKAASDEAIKLASVAGEMINDVVQNLENDQQKSLDRIDYEKTDIAPDVEEIPEHIVATAEDLFIAKMESNLEAEESGQSEGPTDITNLNTVETYEEKDFVQESVDFGNMETISTEELMTQGFENTDIENLSNFDMQADNFNLPDINLGKEEGVVDLPQFSTGGITINEDGSSPMDKMLDMSMAAEETEQKEDELMDMELNGASLDFSSCMKPSTRRKEESRSSSDESRSTMDEETKKALLANNIIRNSDNDDSTEEDFGETITIPVDDEPFEIDTAEIIEDTNDEISVDDLFGESEETEVAEITEEEFPFDDIETLAEEGNETTTDTTSPEELFKDYEEPSVEMPNDDEFLSSADGFTTDFFNVEEEETTKEVAQPEIVEQQDWMEDTDYTALEDVEPQGQEVADDFITEPDANQKEFVAIENSTVISDKTFQTGEIEIDINKQEIPQYDGHESLEHLYDPNAQVPGGALLQNPGRLGASSQGRKASGLLGLLGTLVVLALVGGIGFGVAKFFKAPTDETPQPITDEPLTSTDNGVTNGNTLQIDPNNVVNMDNNYNAIEKSTKTTANKPATNASKPTTNVAKPTTQKKGPAKAFVNIRDMKWTLPDYISRNSQFQQYFLSTSKSLKLSLTTDLLLADDYLYSDQMRVAVTFEKDGTFGTSQVITSSGSNQIDKIVLQTVNQTLKSLKAPNSVGNDENTTAVLNIYF